MYWDPSVKYMIELWYDHVVNGTPYDAPSDKPVFFLMKDGGSAVAPLYEFEETLPAEALEQYNTAKEQILDGTLEVELKLEGLESD